jgi:HlyD family secretion protein
MDVTRTGYSARLRRRRWLLGAGALLVGVAITAVVSRLEPAPPSVDRDTVYLGTVERGPMLRQLRGQGTLVPVEMRWIPARTRGQIERILLRPGARVEPDSVILSLSNPEVEQAALAAEKALVRAQAELVNLRVHLGSQELDQQARVATMQADLVEAQLRAEADRELAEQGLLSAIQQKVSVARAEALETRHQLARRRLALSSEATRAQLEAKQAEIDQLRTLAELRAGQRDALVVTAGQAGVLQEVPVEEGQQVGPGANLALVAEPSRLQAEVRIPATQARELLLGQAAHVDTRNGVVEGRVARIDPTVRQGTVQVDIELSGELPQGARPDLSVEGRVDIEVLENVLFVERPVAGAAWSSLELFRLEPDGKHASRVPVRLGRASVRAIEVLEGLAEGDQVVISDTRRWDEHERLRLK